MRLPRTLNQSICRLLIGVFLFGQLAVAAYACPGEARGGEQRQEMAAKAMPVGCDQMASMDQMDPQAANLCAEHCKFGHQSSDTSPAPVVLAPTTALLYLLPIDEDVALATQARAASDMLQAAAPPPHAILHCIWRI
jgi:hypothetical protein